jgi:hypothetical protein
MNKKFWEELIAYYPSIVILLSGTTCRKKLQYICLMNLIKTVLEAAMLVLLMELINEAHGWDGFT